MVFHRCSWFAFCLFLLHLPLWGQAVNANLKFRQDTTAVGKPIYLEVSVSHPAEVPVIFPSEAKNFLPFEYVGRKAFPTRTEEGISYDTAVYQLRTFDLENIQSLKLPFFYIEGGDTLKIFSAKDSIQLNYRYQEGSPVDEFRSLEFPIEMTDPPNYTLIILLSVAALVFLIGLFYIMKEPVLKRLRLRNNKKQLEEALFKLKSIPSLSGTPKQLLTLNQLWKDYLDPQHQHKLEALTSTELQEELKQLEHLAEEDREKLVLASQMYDRAVYANAQVPADEINDLLVDLLPIFEAEYLRRKSNIAQE